MCIYGYMYNIIPITNRAHNLRDLLCKSTNVLLTSPYPAPVLAETYENVHSDVLYIHDCICTYCLAYYVIKKGHRGIVENIQETSSNTGVHNRAILCYMNSECVLESRDTPTAGNNLIPTCVYICSSRSWKNTHL